MTTLKKNELYPFHTSIGGYPLFYICEDNSVLCANCTNDNYDKNSEETLITAINWENDCLYCCECSSLIESAYKEE
jgi:hypothetical protein